MGFTVVVRTIGIIGAGNIGQAVARAALAHGYRVRIANSRGPGSLTDVVRRLGDGATAVSTADAAQQDVVVVAIPLSSEPDLPADDLAGRVVIDANNYYPDRDGRIAELDDGSITSAERLQRMLPGSKVVKAFNHIAWPQITADARPAGAPDRRGLAVFGDDASARATATTLIDDLGFDPVDGGALAESWRIHRGQPGYNTPISGPELARRLAEAVPAGP